MRFKLTRKSDHDYAPADAPAPANQAEGDREELRQPNDRVHAGADEPLAPVFGARHPRPPDAEEEPARHNCPFESNTIEPHDKHPDRRDNYRKSDSTKQILNSTSSEPQIQALAPMQ